MHIIELPSTSPRRNAAEVNAYPAQLSSDHGISSGAPTQIHLKSRQNSIIQMSIVQKSSDISADPLYRAFRSHARPGFTCLGSPWKHHSTYILRLGALGKPLGTPGGSSGAIPPGDPPQWESPGGFPLRDPRGGIPLGDPPGAFPWGIHQVDSPWEIPRHSLRGIPTGA